MKKLPGELQDKVCKSVFQCINWFIQEFYQSFATEKTSITCNVVQSKLFMEASHNDLELVVEKLSLVYYTFDKEQEVQKVIWDWHPHAIMNGRSSSYVNSQRSPLGHVNCFSD